LLMTILKYKLLDNYWLRTLKKRVKQVNKFAD